MTEDELVYMEIYSPGYESNNWILKFENFNHNKDIFGYWMNAKNKSFGHSAWGTLNFFNVNGNGRKATFEERMHLEACIKANKFIPLEQVKMSINYEIY